MSSTKQTNEAKKDSAVPAKQAEEKPKPIVYDDVVGIAELGAHIMNHLTLSALIALSYTSRTNFIHVHQYMRFKLKSIFGPFSLALHEVLWKLMFLEAVVVGDAALRAVAPAVLPTTVDVLEFVVGVKELDHLREWLTLSCGYRTKAPNHEPIDGITPYHSCQSFVQTIHNRKMEIDVFVMGGRDQVMEFIFYSSNTARMNMITSGGLFTAYRSLLNRGLVARNHTTNMIHMVPLPEKIKNQVRRWNEVNDARVEEQGLTLLPMNPHQATVCRCEHRSACPLVFRFTNDSMCSFMHIFTLPQDMLLESDPECIPVCHSQRTPVMWRLADINHDLQGVSKLMTYQRIRDLNHLL